MRLQHLAEASGVSVASIKFYLREGLLPPGRPVTATRAEYGPTHLARLRLIRSGRERIGIGLRRVAVLTALIDDPSVPLPLVLQEAQSVALGLPAIDDGAAPVPDDQALSTIPEHWPTVPSRARDAVNRQLASMRRAGWAPSAEDVGRLAALTDTIADREITALPPGSSRDEAAEYVLLGVHAWTELLVRLVGLAQASHAVRRFADERPAGGEEPAVEEEPAAEDSIVDGEPS